MMPRAGWRPIKAARAEQEKCPSAATKDWTGWAHYYLRPEWLEWCHGSDDKKVICNLQKKKLEYKKLWMIYKKND